MSLSVRKSRRKGEYGVYKHNVPLITGVTSKSLAVRIMKNQRKREKELKRKRR